MSATKDFYHDKIEKAMRGNPPKKKPICVHLNHVSQLIKDTTGSGNTYTDSYFKCSKEGKRITRKHCRSCVFYKPLINKPE